MVNPQVATGCAEGRRAAEAGQQRPRDLFAAVVGAGAAGGQHAGPVSCGAAALPEVPYATVQHCRPTPWRAAETGISCFGQLAGAGSGG